MTDDELDAAKASFHQRLVDAGLDPDRPLTMKERLAADVLLFGHAYVEHTPNGPRRIDPMSIVIHSVPKPAPARRPIIMTAARWLYRAICDTWYGVRAVVNDDPLLLWMTLAILALVTANTNGR